ncbi:conserved hypothetical protein [Ricinus communis]|uniref:C2 domain-containing protein n=1 Tax=Ricinus communis TaxID=3988 RepID=B9SQY1_RICCO|nr:conserved hypothetical protein [Ricinus communis]
MAALTQKNKQVVREEDFEIDLDVSIHYAEGLDNPNTYPGVRSRYYKVICWVHPDDQYETHLAQGLPNPVWETKRRMELDKSLDIRFLHVEVLRYNIPGFFPATCSSSGVTVVGRARIPLPKLSHKKSGRHGLVRPEGDGCRADGHIGLTLEMNKLVIPPHRSFR